MVITGSIEEIRFVNQENGYHIVVLKSGDETFIATGTLPPVSEGESLRLTGEFVVHERFGRQFKSERAERLAPTSKEGIFKFLSGGLFKGIGEKTAESIINAFGFKTLEVLEFRPHLLSKIKGISAAKAEAFSEEYKKHTASMGALMFLQGLGLSLNLSLKIYKEYGGDAKAIVSANPYKLIEDIDGVGFITADRIAKGLGAEERGAFRLRAGIICALKESAERGGNTFLFKDELIAEAARLLNFSAVSCGAKMDCGGGKESENDSESGCENFCENGESARNLQNSDYGEAVFGEEKRSGQGDRITDSQLLSSAIDDLIITSKIKPVEIEGRQALFLHFCYASEFGAAGKLISLKNNFKNSAGAKKEIDKDIDEYRRIYGVEFNDQQKAAIALAMNSAVSVITGGPGTGKTTIIKCLIFLFNKRRESFSLMAPTGRAAKRINESTGEDASTIHRAIKLSPGRESSAPIQLGFDNVIVDEVSMLDIFLFYSLLKCVKEGTRLILLGDKDQLPSVGAGNVLSDLLQKMPSVCLTQIYRQGEDSLITLNAHRINEGAMPDLKSTTGDFFFIKRRTGIEIAEEIVRLVSERLPKYLGISPDRIQVLCPMKNGAAGANNLNALLSARLNTPISPILQSGSVNFKAGDKVMQTSNNYSLPYQRGGESGEGVFNGDMGIIESLNNQVKELTVLFEDGKRAVYTDNISELTQAYAITIHKSQGSEFDAVVLPAIIGSPQILTRNLLYTAITRARRLVVIVGDEYAIKRMVDNDYIAKRNSGLSSLLDTAESNYYKLFGGSGADAL